MTKKTKKKVLFTVVLLAVICFLTTTAVEASEKFDNANLETIDFRILSTGDLHGQATAYNYEADRSDPMYGLSKIATLINEAKSEVPKNNSILVDAGDFLYDYSTNYFYDNQPDTIQPLMQIMDLLKYDCITLGNHEFDYPWEYLQNQLKGSKLWDKTVVSNLSYIDSMENVFAPSMIITKNVTTSAGNTIELRIGVVGATRQALSTRREYYGFLIGSDIYTSVSKEAKRLKDKEGVDIVVALIHGGIGVLSGSNTITHPGGRLAKSSYIDAVVTSHSHEVFPAKNGTYSDPMYANIVDEQKGLVHKTPVVGAGSHATFLGVIDLKLIVNEDGTYKVMSGSSDTRAVTAKTKEVKAPKNLFEPYRIEMSKALDKTKYAIADGMVYTNLDCFIQDSDLYQLYNNAKLKYANTYIRENLPEYRGLPVVACTVNRLDNMEQNIVIEDSFTEMKVSEIISESSFARDSGYIHMYKITGKQLREWLEYNASIYATAGLHTLETVLPSYFKKSPTVTPLLLSEYTDDHSNFFIFDGITYEIDLSKKARYQSNGKMVSYTYYRISSLKYNGIHVTDGQEFIIITDAFSIRYSFMPEDSQSIFKKLPWKNGKEIFIEYLKQLSVRGPIQVKADNNWKIKAPTNYTFAIGMPKDTQVYIESKKWFLSYAATYNKSPLYSIYYRGNFKKTQNLKQGLNVILAASTTKETSQPIEISVIATCDVNASIAEIRYLEGIYKSTTNAKWESAPIVSKNVFSVVKNKTYTVLVKDTLGNKKLEHITISNYKKSIVDVPICNNVTNRMDVITGIALSEAIVNAILQNGTTSFAVADKTGAFTISIPFQNAFDTITVYAELNGKKSNEVEVLVRRTGPNQPIVTSDTSIPTKTFYGTIDPYSTVFLRYGNAIYVNYGEMDLYKASEFYNSTYKIVETNISVAVNGEFYALIPSKVAEGKTIWVYAIDKNNKCSKGTPVTIGSNATNIEELPSEEEEELLTPTEAPESMD